MRTIHLLLVSALWGTLQAQDSVPGDSTAQQAQLAQQNAGAVQEKKPSWKLSLQGSALTTLNTYSDSWDGGEAGSINWTLKFDGSAEKQLAAKLHSANTVKLAFGETHLQDKETDQWQPPVKSTDQIDLESVFKFTLGWFADPYLGMRLESRFWDQAVDTSDVDEYFNPIHLTESFGAARSVIDNDPTSLQLRLGGAAQQSIERLPLNSLRTANDVGIELVAVFKTAAKANWINFVANLKLFKALVSSKADETKEDEWSYPDIDWENTLNINMTKYLMASLTHQLLYDKEIDAEVRQRLSASIGLTIAYKN